MEPDSPAPAPKGQDAWGLIGSALEVGAFTGCGGLLLGGAQGILFSNSPALFAAFSGVQWFTAGSIYWGTRSVLLYRPDGDVRAFSPSQRVNASTIAGGVSGGIVAAATRGRSNIVPGTIMFALFGFAGQSIYNFLDAQHLEREEVAAQEGKEPQLSLFQKLANSRFSPVKSLSNEEYEDMLKEKLLRVETEIALVDDSLESLRQQQAQKNSSTEN
ncbi:uncharacterized protein K452DRAFT_320806 [Aplosporella prunicola CBS 121167]|uniref:Uncharacterized protein n=1 Tax=Aplosporella prunicola CBS 121167 TaxID=1176127 RepID=A0A6A6B3M4_9PEZI|nr:uncharacterized protein K452DRAFT_320806 [Aplosporella prunicola CBS 121167]KAF2138660.1 hypothetical protein K452DRAFT_320806 [Aplosporella prunicola CBS 121167]